eukprot:gnl/TRDRNA2_/TRDRNA2_169008_c3_seq1.p1 gnl/TRDRNA2_/TRDRNA2_169008_c3~~gnl/TRDRNA2_/TRDRNA2_169008_c3_seq1.p1  ORF type:complete len:154 (+),score=22.82 gnl/TRDRNA2_/TRDRNA2_169008_c3_seq1:102-563(+)
MLTKISQHDCILAWLVIFRLWIGICSAEAIKTVDAVGDARHLSHDRYADPRIGHDDHPYSGEKGDDHGMGNSEVQTATLGRVGKFKVLLNDVVGHLLSEDLSKLEESARDAVIEDLTDRFDKAFTRDTTDAEMEAEMHRIGREIQALYFHKEL